MLGTSYTNPLFENIWFKIIKGTVMDNIDFDLIKKYKTEKYIKLLVCICIDLVGLSSFLIPFLGEATDVLWAFISGFAIYTMFPKRKILSLVGTVEEFLPLTDVLPTATLTWITWYKFSESKAKKYFVDKSREDFEIFRK